MQYRLYLKLSSTHLNRFADVPMLHTDMSMNLVFTCFASSSYTRTSNVNCLSQFLSLLSLHMGLNRPVWHCLTTLAVQCGANATVNDRIHEFRLTAHLYYSHSLFGFRFEVGSCIIMGGNALQICVGLNCYTFRNLCGLPSFDIQTSLLSWCQETSSTPFC